MRSETPCLTDAILRASFLSVSGTFIITTRGKWNGDSGKVCHSIAAPPQMEWHMREGSGMHGDSGKMSYPTPLVEQHVRRGSEMHGDWQNAPASRMYLLFQAVQPTCCFAAVGNWTQVVSGRLHSRPKFFLTIEQGSPTGGWWWVISSQHVTFSLSRVCWINKGAFESQSRPAIPATWGSVHGYDDGSVPHLSLWLSKSCIRMKRGARRGFSEGTSLAFCIQELAVSKINNWKRPTSSNTSLLLAKVDQDLGLKHVASNMGQWNLCTGQTDARKWTFCFFLHKFPPFVSCFSDLRRQQIGNNFQSQESQHNLKNNW